MTTEIKPARRQIKTPPDHFDLWDQTEVEKELRGFNTFISLTIIIAVCLSLLTFCAPTHAYDYYEAERRADERQAEADRRADERQRQADQAADNRAFWERMERNNREFDRRYEATFGSAERERRRNGRW
jgi:hypothetical protein